MREEWSRFGYTSALPGLGEYEGAAQIKDKLSLWCADTELTSHDVLVLYFAGHGVVEEHDRHYLLCWDSREEDCAATALPTEDLVRILCRGELRNVLILLDTCSGGAGAADAATAALKTIAYRQSGADVQTGLWFLSSARHKDVADDGAFAAEFPAAVRVATARTGQRQQYLDLAEIVRAINERFEVASPGQRAVLAGGLVTGLAPFLANSGFRDDLPPVGTDLEIQRRVAAQDLYEHFGPRSRGVEFESEQGLYFSGRKEVLKQLVEWMNDPSGDAKGRVVTGSPGCGKSAVLGRIVATSDSWYRARLDLSDSDPATIAPEGGVTAAVHARHKRLEEIVARIADALGVTVEGTADLLQELSRRGRGSDKGLVVVVDALDEAGSGTAADAGGHGEPRRIARELLRPMSDIPGVRLLVGTRRELLNALGPTLTLLNLDDPAYRDDEDIAGYVRQVLLATAEPDVRTPYRGQEALAATVANGVAKRAAGVFLVARMTARSLRHTASVDVSQPGWIDALPSEIGAAFDDFLARFGAEEPRVRRMLLPLAFAEGHGLPRGQIWTALSSALSGIECAEADIASTLDLAKAYIAEVIGDDRSAYRLYHQALAEHLRVTAGPSQAQARRIQEQVVNALIATVPLADDGTRRDWFAAVPYVRLHLATHARASGQLESLIEDPGFLLASGQLALLSAFPAIRSEEGRRIRTAYEQVAHRLTADYPLNGRGADLQLSARRCGADGLASRISALGLELPWITRWAWWSTTGAHRQLVGHENSVTCVAAGHLDGRPIAVTGSADESARIWDLVTQQQVGKALSAGISINAVAVGDLADYTVALTGGVDGVVRVWDLSAAQEFGAPLIGHTNRVEAIAAGTVGERDIALTASADGTVRIWDMAAREPVGAPLTAHRRTVRAVALSELDGKPVAVTGGDDQRLYVWDLSGIAEGRDEAWVSGRPLIGLAGAATAIALSWVGNQLVAVVGDDAGMLSAWDVMEGQQIGEPVVAHRSLNGWGVHSVAIGMIGPTKVVLTAGSEGARLWELDGLRQRGHPLRGHVNDINAAALASDDSLAEGGSRPMGVTVSRDETARIWDLTADRPAAGHVQNVLAIAGAEVNGQSLAVTGGVDGTARLWDLRAHKEIGRPMEGHTGSVLAVALGSRGDHPVAVTAGADATIRIWDPVGGIQAGKALEGHTNAVRCLRLVECDQRLVAVTGSEDGTIRLWDVAAHAPIDAPIVGHIGEIVSLDVRNDANGIEIVAATSLQRVYIWRVAPDMTKRTLEIKIGRGDLIPPGVSGHILDVGFRDKNAVVMATHSGSSVRIYDVRTRGLIGIPLESGEEPLLGAVIGSLGAICACAVMSRDGVRLFDVETGQQVGDYLACHGPNGEFEFAQVDGRGVGLVAFGDVFQACDLMTMRPILEPFCGGEMGIASVSIVRDSSNIVVITQASDATIRTHDLSEGNQITSRLTFGINNYSCITIARAGGRNLVVRHYWKEASIWDLDSRRQAGEFLGPSTATSTASCGYGDDAIVVVGYLSGEILAWDLATRAVFCGPLKGHSSHVTDVCVRVGNDSLLAASGSSDGTVRIWDLRAGSCIGDPLVGHAYGAYAVCLGSVDGREVIMTGDGDGVIRMWDTRTSQPVDLGFEPHSGAIIAIQMEQIAGRSIAVTADANGLIRTWDLRAACCQAEVNIGSGINDIALTSDGDLCVGTGMGVAALKLNLAAEPVPRSAR